jgi:hypothetical protein
MKKFKSPLTKLVIILCLLCFSKVNFAQDTLVKKNNKGIIVCKVKEIGLDEIKYKDWNNLDGPDFVISKSDLTEIKFQNGTKMIIAPDELSLEMDQKVIERKKDIKFNFFSPLWNHLGFGFETVLKPRTDIEAKLGIIGIGNHSQYSDGERVAGGYLQVGGKFYLGEDFYSRGQRRVHPLKGKYFKLELSFVSYNSNTYVYNSVTSFSSLKKINVYAGAINIIYGKQYLLGDRFTFEYYFGAGFGVRDDDSANGDIFDYTNCYAFQYFNESFPMTVTSGVTLGYIFK